MPEDRTYYEKRYRYGILSRRAGRNPVYPAGFITGSHRDDSRYPYGTIDYPMELPASVLIEYQMLPAGEIDGANPQDSINPLVRLRQIQLESVAIALRLPAEYGKLSRHILIVMRESPNNNNENLGDTISVYYKDAFGTDDDTP